MKTYPKMKETSIPWLTKIPEHWMVRRIKDFYHRKTEKNRPDGEVLSLYRDLGIVIKSSREDNFNRTSEDTSNYNVVDVHDLVVNKMKAWQGSVAVSEYQGIVSPAYYVCCPYTKKAYWRYIHLLLRASIYHPEYRRLSEGIRLGQWDLSYDDWKNILIPLPPLAEQQAIATYLDKATAKIDGLIAAQEKLIELLAEKRKVLISHVITKGLNPKVKMKDTNIAWLGKIPEHWQVKPLKYCTRLITEKSEKKSFNQVALENIESWSGRFLETESKFEGDGTSFSKNDVLFGKLRPYLAKILLAERDGESVGDIFVLRPMTEFAPKYIAQTLRTTNYIEVINSSTYGSKMPRVSWEFMGALSFPLPPLDEQRAIAEYLDKATAKLDALAAKAEEAIALMKERRSALISAVVTGKVRVS